MSTPNLNDTVAVDIDGTLLTPAGTIDQGVMAWIERTRAKGMHVILWSIRGHDYANAFAQEHGIAHLFIAIIGKPCVIVDDRGWAWSHYSRAIHPSALRRPTTP